MEKLYSFLFALLATATLTAQTPAAQVPVTQAPAAQTPAAQEATLLAEEELSGQCGENLYWHYADGTLTITGSGEMLDYSSFGATAAPWYSVRDSITTIDLPQGQTSIGTNAFRLCKNIKHISITDSVTLIGDYAFASCYQLSSVAIGKRVTTLGKYAFAYCDALKHITIPDSVTTINDNAFCSGVSLLTVTIGRDVSQIGNRVFSSCKVLCHINMLAETPPTITSSTFSNTTARVPIFIPCGAQEAYANAEYWNECDIQAQPSHTIYTLTEDILKGSAQVSKSLCGNNNIEITATPNGGYLFSRWSDGVTDNPRTIVLNQDTTFTALFTPIYSGTCGENLQWTYNAGVLSITGFGEMNSYSSSYSSTGAFMTNSAPWQLFRDSISIINLPTNLTSIGSYAFVQCKNVKNITIPDSVKTIGIYAFSGCKVSTVYWNARNCAKTFYQNYSGSMDYSQYGPFMGGRDSITTFIIGESVDSIPAYLCYGMSKLQHIRIPEKITTINDKTFYNCNSLQDINLNHITAIGSSAFYGCKSLVSVKIQNTNQLGSGAFSSCSALSEVFIGSNLNAISSSAFSGCTSLSLFTIENATPPAIDTYAFRNVRSDMCVLVPCGSRDTYLASDWGQFNLQEIQNYKVSAYSSDPVRGYVLYEKSDCQSDSLVITAVANTNYVFSSWSDGSEDATRRIKLTQDTTLIAHFAYTGVCGDNAHWTFIDGLLLITGSGDMYDYNSSTIPWILLRDSITMISIGQNITSIGDYAFYQCKNITSVIIPNKVKSIGIHAFRECTNLSSVIIGRQVESIGTSAFNGCTLLSAIMIPASVIDIGSGAFRNTAWYSEQPKGIVYINSVLYDYKGTVPRDTALVVKAGTVSISPSALAYNRILSVTIPNSVTAIGSYAFYSKLTTLRLESTTPPTMEKQNSSIYTQATLYVPCGAVDTYASAESYQKFSNIRERSAFDITLLTNDYNKGYCTTAQSSCESSNVTIVAIPTKNQYSFSRWSDGNTDNPRMLTLAQDTTLTAMFDYAVSGHCGDNLYWAYDPIDRTLTITGDGDMYNYNNNSQPWYNWRNTIVSISLPQGITSIGSYAFYNCSKLTAIDFPDNVTSIGTNAFSSCNALAFITGCNNVQHIERYAFSTSCIWYRNLSNGPVYIKNVLYSWKGTLPNGTEISIREGTTSISPSVFSGKSSTFSIILPSTLQNIGQEAFRNCKNLTSITSYAEVPPTCDENVFYNVPTSTPLYVPETAIEAYKTTEPWSEFTDIRVICVPKQYNVQVMACDADYYDWNGVIYTESGTYTQTLANIYGCDSIVNMTLTFKQNDFSYTIDDVAETATITGLRNDTITHVVIPEMIGCDILYPIVAIEDNAFAGNTAITFVSAENNVETIGSRAFSGCTALGKLTLGQNMQTIGENAFFGCRNLIHTCCHATNPPYAEQNSFYNYNGYLYVPCNSLETYQTDMVFGSFKFIRCSSDITTDAEPVHITSDSETARKIVRDGQLYIVRGDKTYTLTGEEVK